MVNIHYMYYVNVNDLHVLNFLLCIFLKESCQIIILLSNIFPFLFYYIFITCLETINIKEK